MLGGGGGSKCAGRVDELVVGHDGEGYKVVDDSEDESETTTRPLPRGSLDALIERWPRASNYASAAASTTITVIVVW